MYYEKVHYSFSHHLLLLKKTLNSTLDHSVTPKPSYISMNYTNTPN